MLPRELSAVPPQSLARLEQTYSMPAANGSDEPLPMWKTLADVFVDVLLNPLGDAESKLKSGASESDNAIHCDLFWRCCIAVSLMPLQSLTALARHHADLKPHLAPDDAPEAERCRRLVLGVLPRFAMVCSTREEREAAAKRRVEIEELKKQRQAEAEADAKRAAMTKEEALAAAAAKKAAAKKAADAEAKQRAAADAEVKAQRLDDEEAELLKKHRSGRATLSSNPADSSGGEGVLI